MSSKLNPYLTFDGNAREAMEFYRDVFGGELEMMTFGQFGQQETPDKIMHSHLETPSGFSLMAADAPPQMEFKPGNTMAVSLGGDDHDDLHGYWDRLSDGGQVMMPLEKQSWGDEFGMCTDRYGTAWMVNING